MVPGTTPLHIFKLPFDTSLIHSVRISYEQNKKIVLTKETEEITMHENKMAVRLSQEETLLFHHLVTVRVQLHILTQSGDALVSRIKHVPPYVLLDRREIK